MQHAGHTLQWGKNAPSGRNYLEVAKKGQTPLRHELRVGVTPLCYSFLRSPRLGVELPVVYGDEDGVIVADRPPARPV